MGETDGVQYFFTDEAGFTKLFAAEAAGREVCENFFILRGVVIFFIDTVKYTGKLIAVGVKNVI